MKEEITTYANCVEARLRNRRLLLIPRTSKKHGDEVLIRIQNIDGNTDPRSQHFLSHNGKVVNTQLAISEEAAKALYMSLRMLFVNHEHITKTKIKTTRKKK